MSARITDADRAAAHVALTEKPITCDDMRPGISHDWICEDVAQALADAREAENLACEEIARFRLQGEQQGALRDALHHALLDIQARRRS